MKFPFVFLIALVVLPTIIFVMLASTVMTELGIFLDRNKEF